ncbi:hypothetical protein ACFL54_06965 [Planctomycetota bacterium]
MARRKLPSTNLLWKRHEDIYVSIFFSALSELASRKLVEGNEDVISESLCPILRKLCFDNQRSGFGEIRTPVWEAPIQPVNEDELNNGNQKRPDFTCSLYNSCADSPEELEIPFHVECKLLGEPTSPSWNLCKNYTTNGIARFDNTTHAYGERASSGVMIGYIISMTPKTVLKNINQYKRQEMKQVPDIVFRWVRETFVWKSRNAFNRAHVQPMEFCLTHIWVNLNHNYKKKP